MKGTIDASCPNARQVILADHKESAEHATIVDLIRNDISMVSQKVWVERYRFIDEIRTSEKTLLQVSSEIAGELSAEFDGQFGDILMKLSTGRIHYRSSKTEYPKNHKRGRRI